MRTSTSEPRGKQKVLTIYAPPRIRRALKLRAARRDSDMTHEALHILEQALAPELAEVARQESETPSGDEAG